MCIKAYRISIRDRNFSHNYLRWISNTNDTLNQSKSIELIDAKCAQTKQIIISIDRALCYFFFLTKFSSCCVSVTYELFHCMQHFLCFCYQVISIEICRAFECLKFVFLCKFCFWFFFFLWNARNVERCVTVKESKWGKNYFQFCRNQNGE